MVIVGVDHDRRAGDGPAILIDDDAGDGLLIVETDVAEVDRSPALARRAGSDTGAPCPAPGGELHLAGREGRRSESSLIVAADGPLRAVGVTVCPRT